MGTDVENVRHIVATAMDKQAKVTTGDIRDRQMQKEMKELSGNLQVLE